MRLEVCKSLITLQAADESVVSILEKMSREPEAIAYDAEIAELERICQRSRTEVPDEPQVEMWGKIETILEQARQMAAQQG